MKYLLILLVFTLCSFAEYYQEYNPNDDRFKILALKKSISIYRNAEEDYKRSNELFEKGMISKEDFDSKKMYLENSRLNFMQYYLNLIFENPHLTILSAEKRVDNHGNSEVYLKIGNSGSSSYDFDEIFKEYGDLADDLKLVPPSLKNIFISLKDDYGSIISQPYEYHISSFDFDKTCEISFKLLKDVENLTVSANYNGKIDEKKIYLKRLSEVNRLTVNSDIFSQEIMSSESGEYGLELEYYGDSREFFKFEVQNLPKFYTWELTEKNGRSVSSIVMDKKNFKRNLILKISVPDFTGSNIELDKSFIIKTVFKSESSEEIANAELEVIPTGKAIIEFSSDNMYYLFEKSEEMKLGPFKIKNDGMKKINDVKVIFTAPNGFDYKIDSEKFSELKIGEENHFFVTLNPNPDVTPGIYNVKVKCEGKASGRIISTSTNELKLELKAKASIITISILSIASLMLIGFVSYIIIKFTKN
ncbi:MAG: hypothetical protein JXR48_14860 [Candidatus Delongbacteria bacterium]|nr:hypothetical protein [Candidatus Delongbacteria bacterium]MBN2836237.1 hypothetical protein [Candidatus Delongbacteria bacterium]